MTGGPRNRSRTLLHWRRAKSAAASAGRAARVVSDGASSHGTINGWERQRVTGNLVPDLVTTYEVVEASADAVSGHPRTAGA